MTDTDHTITVIPDDYSDDDFGNRDPQARPARRRKQFGPDFDPSTLATAEDCRATTAAIDEEIASIAGALEVYAGQDRSVMPPEMISWLTRASCALAHRKRARYLIGQRHAEIIGNFKGADPEKVQRIITERIKLKHKQELQLAQIRASPAQADRFKDALCQLICERFGKAVWRELAVAAGAMVERDCL